MSWLTGPSKPNPVIGYRYFLGMQMITGHGNIDGLEKIKVGEKVVWTPSDILCDSYTTVLTALSVTPQAWIAQVFTATSNYTLSSVALPLYRYTNYYPGIITVSIRLVDVDGHPTGSDLCIGAIDGDTEIRVSPPTLSSVNYVKIKFHSPILLSSGTKYAIIVRTTESGVYDDCAWVAGNINGYSGGTYELSTDMGKTWTTPSLNYDLLFKTYKKEGTPPNHTIKINAQEAFGGNKGEGGIYGNVDLMFGDIAQTQNPYLVSKLDSDIPAFRGLMSFILNRVYLGTSPYIKPWSFFCKRVGKQISGDDQWYKEKAVIRPGEEAGDDLNPAHIIRECLVDIEWGLGYSVNDIDDDSFKEAANILYDEGFGLSYLWDQTQPIEEVIDEILACIAGFLYQNLATGKWILSLTRDSDYINPYIYNNTGDNNQGSRNNQGLGKKYQFAQSFTTTRNFTISKTKLKIYRVGTITVRVELQETDADGKPNGNILAHGTIPNASIPLSAGWVECTFVKSYDLKVNTVYALVVYPMNSGTFYWRVNTNSSF